MLGYIPTDARLVLTFSLGVCVWSPLETGYWARWAFAPSQSSSSYVVSVCTGQHFLCFFVLKVKDVRVSGTDSQY